jgi:23S rRNA (pseudouridine1915-N3)-methyltransferase
MRKLTLIACGHKMPTWVEQAVCHFSKHLQAYTKFTLIQIPSSRRRPNCPTATICLDEATKIMAVIPVNARLIAFDVVGTSFSSHALAVKLSALQQITSHLCLLIGGPYGLSPQLLAQTVERWSLSTLTLPHPLVRIIALETLYRAFSMIHNHPYHK